MTQHNNYGNVTYLIMFMIIISLLFISYFVIYSLLFCSAGECSGRRFWMPSAGDRWVFWGMASSAVEQLGKLVEVRSVLGKQLQQLPESFLQWRLFCGDDYFLLKTILRWTLFCCGNVFCGAAYFAVKTILLWRLILRWSLFCGEEYFVVEKNSALATPLRRLILQWRLRCGDSAVERSLGEHSSRGC